MTTFVLIFIVLTQQPTHVSMKTWKHPAEFASAKDCKDAGDAYAAQAPNEKIQFSCNPVL